MTRGVEFFEGGGINFRTENFGEGINFIPIFWGGDGGGGGIKRH